MPCLYLGIWDPFPHLRGATVLKEAHALQCITAGPYNATPADLLRAGSVCGLGVDLFGLRILSLAAPFRTAANSNTLVNGLSIIF